LAASVSQSTQARRYTEDVEGFMKALSAAVVAVALFAGAAALSAQQPAPKPQQWTGKLQMGMVAPGGETTGIVLMSGTDKFELEAADKTVRAAMDKLDQKDVVVTGTLRVQAGIEVKERRIITVTKIVAKPKS
jgi:hypothetical protein